MKKKIITLIGILIMVIIGIIANNNVNFNKIPKNPNVATITEQAVPCEEEEHQDLEVCYHYLVEYNDYEINKFPTKIKVRNMASTTSIIYKGKELVHCAGCIRSDSEFLTDEYPERIDKAVITISVEYSDYTYDDIVVEYYFDD